MSGFMSNYDPVLVNRLAIRPEKHIDIHILWNKNALLFISFSALK